MWAEFKEKQSVADVGGQAGRVEKGEFLNRN